jgi:cytochrome c oxidase subunit 2
MLTLAGSGLLALGLLGATLVVYREATSAEVSAPSAIIAADPVSQGKTLFQSKGCIGCHHVSDKGLRSQTSIGPDLSGLARNGATRRPNLDAAAYIRESIRQPAVFQAPGFGGSDMLSMPILPVTDPELETLVAFLLS